MNTHTDTLVTLRHLLDAAIASEKKGDMQHAEGLAHQALRQEGATKEIVVYLARLSQKMGKHGEAIALYRQAIAFQPSHLLQFELIENLVESGALQEAEQEARAALSKRPKDFLLMNLLGIILKRQERYRDALKIFEKAAKLDPKSISPWVNSGNIYISLGEAAKAVKYFSKATQIEPKNGECFRLLASAYSRMGEYGKALQNLQAAVLRAPKHALVRADMCGVYYTMHNYPKAALECEKALHLFPNDRTLLRTYGAILRKLGRIEEAMGVYNHMLSSQPNDVKTLLNLANLYYLSLEDREQANNLYARALEIEPGNAQVILRYADCLLNSRYGNEAEHIERAYQLALTLLSNSKTPWLYSNPLQAVLLRCADVEACALYSKGIGFSSNAVPDVGELHNKLGRVKTMDDRFALMELHRKWGRHIEKNAAQHPVQRTGSRSKRDKIRIGFMSSDLRNHPVSYFTLPVIEGYDKSRFELYCYSFYPGDADSVQQLIMGHVDKFRLMPAHATRNIAQKIADDDLDILFELGGTTLLNKIDVCAYRPAPLQVSWLGYPHSSGLSAIDYIVVDPYINPEQEGLLIEKPFIMQESWVTLGRLGFIDIPLEEIPEEHQGFVTFGTMNNPYKYTAELFACWAAILQQVPNSKFLFVRPECAVSSFRRNIGKQFHLHGIEEERILFKAVRGKHMPEYNQIDIALDSFPHTGGTTSCETLWMGVPVVTLIGSSFFERLSYSNVSNAGLRDLCARSVEDYIAIAVQLAGDKTRRKKLKRELREQVRRNPLGQTERFVRNFETKISELVRGQAA
jgi:protein O-GlcNAc transferase